MASLILFSWNHWKSFICVPLFELLVMLIHVSSFVMRKLSNWSNGSLSCSVMTIISSTVYLWVCERNPEMAWLAIILFNLFCCHSCKRKTVCYSSRLCPLIWCLCYSLCTSRCSTVSLVCTAVRLVPYWSYMGWHRTHSISPLRTLTVSH